MKFLFLSVIFVLSISLFSQNTNNSNPKEKQMIDEINLVRTNPKKYSEFIQEYSEYIKDNFGLDKQMEKDITELINFLNKMKALKKLEFSDDLYLSSKKVAKKINKTNKIEHSRGVVAENLVAGFESPRIAVIDLLVDNGIISRGHRKNILADTFTKVAVAQTNVNEYGIVYVQQFE